MEKIRKSLLILLAVVISMSFISACDKGSGGTNGTNGDYTVWVVNSSEKICRNIEYSNDMKAQKSVNFSMCRNEYEGAQVIITPKKDVKNYTVSVSPLICGTTVITSDNIDVYNEKYIELVHKFNSNKEYPNGTEVPDAILPFDAAVKYGENHIVAGENQGIYIEVHTQSYMAAGIYKGNITLDIDGSKIVIPIRVNVMDFVISETGNTFNYMSTFGRDSYATLELDGSDEMSEIYFEKWLSYRMCSDLPFSGKGGPEHYVELLRKYYNHTGFSTYRFFYQMGGGMYKGIYPTVVDYELLKQYITAVVKASLEDKVNYLDKAFFYFSNWIDEPHTEEHFQNVVNALTFYDEFFKDMDFYLTQELADTNDYAYYVDVVRDTLLHIPCVLPEDMSTTAGEIEDRGISNLTHCPVLQLFGSADARSNILDDEEHAWWYTCVQPTYPYPSNHLDDYVLGFRIMSWMQKAYNIAGYLNWAVCNYVVDNYATKMVENPYEKDSRGYVPGDGFMFYPGAMYGVSGPVASLRCVNYRDGLEEYEYLTVLDDTYNNLGVDSSKVLKNVYARLFNGVIPITDSNVFYDVREDLLNLIIGAIGDFGIIYKDTSINGTMAHIKFTSPNENLKVYVGAMELVRDAEGFYNYDMDLTTENYLNLTLKYKGEEKKVSRRIAGKVNIISVDNESDIEYFGKKAESEISLNTDAAYISNGSGSAKIVLWGKYYGEGNESQTNAYEPFIRVATNIFGNSLANVESIIFRIYNAENYDVALSANYYDSQSNFIDDYILKPGWNSVEIHNVYSLSNINAANYIFLRTGNLLDGTKPVSITLYIDDMTYTTMQ